MKRQKSVIKSQNRIRHTCKNWRWQSHTNGKLSSLAKHSQPVFLHFPNRHGRTQSNHHSRYFQRLSNPYRADASEKQICSCAEGNLIPRRIVTYALIRENRKAFCRFRNICCSWNLIGFEKKKENLMGYSNKIEMFRLKYYASLCTRLFAQRKQISNIFDSNGIV